MYGISRRAVSDLHRRRRSQTIIGAMARRHVACVSYYTPGFGESSRVVDGVSVCDVARSAIEAFQSDCWHGPPLALDTWLEVTVVGSQSKPYWVTVRKALELSERSRLAGVISNGAASGP